MGKLTAKTAHDDSADLFIYDDIGGGGITAAEIKNELRELGKVSRLRIHMNCLGGSLFEGLSIYTMLAQHTAFKTTVIEGVAASIASIIALAGDEVHMAADGLVMIHNPWTTSTGNAAELQKSIDLLEKTTNQLVNIYCRRTGGDPAVIRELMEAESWLDANEASTMGFVDYVIESTRLAAQADFQRFKNPPHHLARQYGVCAKAGRVNRKQIVTRNQIAYMNRQTDKLKRGMQ